MISPYLLSLLQHHNTSAVSGEASAGWHRLLPVQWAGRVRVLPPVPGLVVLLGKPGNHQIPDGAAHSAAPPASRARGGLGPLTQAEDIVPAVPQSPGQRHRPVHVGLRLLLPLRVRLREGSPALPRHWLRHGAAAPGQTVLARELNALPRAARDIAGDGLGRKEVDEPRCAALSCLLLLKEGEKIGKGDRSLGLGPLISYCRGQNILSVGRLIFIACY